MNIQRKVKTFMQDIDGSLMPLVAAIVIIVIMVATVNVSLLMMHRDRATVRNALDAAVASSLTVNARMLTRDTTYTDSRYCLDDSGRRCVTTSSGDCSDGSTNSTYRRRRLESGVCVFYQWQNRSSSTKNYIQLPTVQADNTAHEYFIENLALNSGAYEDFTEWDFYIKYDNERTYDVYKDRPRISEPRNIQSLETRDATCNSRSCNSSSSRDYTRIVQPRIENVVTNPDSWWLNDFAGADTGSWSPPSGWGGAEEESKTIIFPRWVEVTATAEVEIQIPFGRYVGRDSYPVKFQVTAFKELADVIR